MTKTHQLLDLMAHGRPVTYGDILKATGWTLAQAQKVVAFAVHSGYVKSIPHDYVITAAGIERQKFKPKTPQPKMDRSTAARRARRIATNQEEALQQEKTESMVQKSVRTNANSVFMLGEM